MAKAKPARSIAQLQINPKNGALVALASDGSVWMHDGQIATRNKPWLQLPPLPNPKTKPEESEDDATTIV